MENFNHDLPMTDGNLAPFGLPETNLEDLNQRTVELTERHFQKGDGKVSEIAEDLEKSFTEREITTMLSLLIVQTAMENMNPSDIAENDAST